MTLLQVKALDAALNELEEARRSTYSHSLPDLLKAELEKQPRIRTMLDEHFGKTTQNHIGNAAGWIAAIKEEIKR